MNAEQYTEYCKLIEKFNLNDECAKELYNFIFKWCNEYFHLGNDASRSI